jgi:hypothetical protein
MAPQNKGAEKLKNTNYLTLQKASSWTPKKFILRCFVTIRVQQWFVELHAALL